MTSYFRRLQFVVAVIGLLCLNSSASGADVVLHWDDIAVKTLTSQTPALNPFQQARFAAIIQLAVFEAVNATTRDYEPYLGSRAARGAPSIVAALGASTEAAAVAAAHAVLLNYFPGNALTLNAERDASLGAIPDGPSKTNGIAVGLAAAAGLIAYRLGDGASPLTFYHPPSPVPVGQWDITPGCPADANGNPLGGVLLNWRDVKPFGIIRAPLGHWTDAFRPAPPPALTSDRYALDYEEVKRVGGVGSADRPDDRAIVARFYGALSPTFLFHSVARQLAEARGDSLLQNARTLALVSMATSDSLVASFATKYRVKFWRPVTAIRAGDADGNPDTEPDITFTPFIVTPCFPSYPSNHASGSNGAIGILRRIFGEDGHVISLTGTVPVVGLVTKEYSALQDISHDIDDARIYGGIHFRFDQEAGVKLGDDIAAHIIKYDLRPLP